MYQTHKFEENGDVRKNAAKSDELLNVVFINLSFKFGAMFAACICFGSSCWSKLIESNVSIGLAEHNIIVYDMKYTS